MVSMRRMLKRTNLPSVGGGVNKVRKQFRLVGGYGIDGRQSGS